MSATQKQPENITVLTDAIEQFEDTIKKRRTFEEDSMAQLRHDYPEEAPFGPLTEDMDQELSQYERKNQYKISSNLTKLVDGLPDKISHNDANEASTAYLRAHSEDLSDSERQLLQSRIRRYANILSGIPKKAGLEELLDRTLVPSINEPRRIGRTFHDTVSVGYEVMHAKIDPKTGRQWISFEDPRSLRGSGFEKTVSKQPILEVTHNSDGTITAEVDSPPGKTITFSPDDETYKIIEDDNGKKKLVHYIPANRMSLSSALDNSPTAQMIVRNMGLDPEEFGIHTADISDKFRPVVDGNGNLTVNPHPVDVAKRD